MEAGTAGVRGEHQEITHFAERMDSKVPRVSHPDAARSDICGRCSRPDRWTIGHPKNVAKSRMMLWTAPTCGIDVPKGGCVKANYYEGSRPWAKLAQLVSILRSRYSRFMAWVSMERWCCSKVLEFFSALSPCLNGIEACPSAHHWSRRLQALGHTVRLMPPNYVKAYLKRSRNDANDAAAICETVTRPSMRFVPTKSAQKQSGLMLHRSRQLLVRQRTMLSNALRGHIGRVGYHLGQGPQWHG